MDCSIKGLRPSYLQRKVKKYLMEHPNASWNNLGTHIIKKDIILHVSSKFRRDIDQTTSELATLGEEMKNLRTKLQEHQVNAMSKTQKEQQKNCPVLLLLSKKRRNSKLVSQKMREEKIRRVRRDMSFKRMLLPYTNTELRNSNCRSKRGPMSWFG